MRFPGTREELLERVKQVGGFCHCYECLEEFQGTRGAHAAWRDASEIWRHVDCAAAAAAAPEKHAEA